MRKTKFKRLEKLLFLSPLLLLIIPLLQYLQSDQLEREMARLTEKNTVDCGVAHGKTLENNTMNDRDTADNCAVAAFEKGQPFRVRYDNEIPDAPDGKEIESLGIVRTTDGITHFLSYDIQYPFTQISWKRTLDFHDHICPRVTVIENPHGNINAGKQFVGCYDCDNTYSRSTGTCYWPGNTD